MVVINVFFQGYNLSAQCINPILDAGLFCDTDAPDSAAPIICNLDCLDGFTATMPINLLPDQPGSLCGSNGTPNNLSWFAFVAGDATIDVTITPTNCQPGSVFSGNPADNLIGIQTGIYSSCSFEEEDIVTCFWDCHGHGDAPVTLSSDQFIAGEVYYLFVDGCGGSVCDYTVTVNAAVQAFEMPEITTITNEYNFDFAVDTICQGAEILFTLDGFDFEYNFEWKIEPPISEYPTGVHPVTDNNTVEFVFSDEGVFDIIVFAYNECDSNEPDTFQVVVKPLGDELFSDVTLCEECITNGFTLVSPDAGCIIGEGTPLILTEDPNGDGILGWQGLTEVSGAGLQTNTVQNVLGCEYDQFVNIVEIPLSPREEIDLYFCFYEFPKNVDGVIFNTPGQTRDITINNGAVSGCDSLISITAHGIDFLGVAEISDCVDGMISINFSLSFVEPSNYDSITYRWVDNLGNTVLDSDGLDDVLEVVNPGSYAIEVTVYKDGEGCMQEFGSYEVDAESLIPNDPMVAFAPNQICITEEQALIYLNNQGLGENYEWAIDPALPFIYGLTTDTIYVDITSGEDFQFCISASNDCGSSEMICDVVNVSAVPLSEFMMQEEVCLDSTFIIEYIDVEGIASNSEFYWTFDGANILNTTSLLGPGPFELQFDDSGTYNISMYMLNGGCQSELVEKTILVTSTFDAPMINCTSLYNEVVFTFDDSVIDGFEVEVLTGQSFEIIGMNSVVFTGLDPEESVDISILFNDDHVCGGKVMTGSCMALPCPNIEFVAELSNQNQCIDQDIRPINLMVNVLGLDSGDGQWISPFVNGDNEFDVAAAGVGSHVISYNYDVVGCNFSFDTTIYLYGSPVLEYDINATYCEEDVVARLIIDEEENTLKIDGEEILDMENIEFSESGVYQLELTNAEGCSTFEELLIEPLEIDPSEIIGQTEVVSGNIIDFETNDLGPLPDVMYSWYLDGELLCDDCYTVSFEVARENEQLCMIATYDDGCEQEACIDLSVTIVAELYVPNIFSPNGDGINDNFKFQSNAEDLMIESISIFSRWGELMFESSGSISNEESIMWDGNYNGQPTNGGVYIYIIRYLDLEGNMVQKTGDVTLMR